MSRILGILSVLAPLLALHGGCIIVDGDGDDTGAETGSNSSGADETGGSMMQIADCQKACDDMQFFGCLTADEHATCYSACNAASASAIDLFSACVGNTLPNCDEAVPCYDNFIEADPPAGSSSGGGGTGSCTDSCNEWIAAGCEAFTEAPSCQAFCDGLSETLQQAVVECVDNRDGCTLPPECAF